MWTRFDAYFDGVRFEWWAVILFRLCFYLLIALDSFTLAWGSRALRTDRLSITKLPVWIEGLEGGPSLDLHVTTLTCTFLFALCGCLLPWKSERVLSQCLTAVGFNAYYWTNATDGYQHHYLLCVLLVLVPLAIEGDSRYGWGRRLLCMQVGIVYFWTAVTKIDGSLGFILPIMIKKKWVHEWVSDVAAAFGMHSDARVWSALGWSTVAVELFIAGALLWPKFSDYRLRLMVILAGVSLHAGIEFLGNLSIRFFSFYMITFFLLLLPAPHLADWRAWQRWWRTQPLRA